MANVEIRLKLNVDLDIKAEREDIPQLTDSVKQQIAGAFAPVALLGNGHRNPKPVEQLAPSDGVSPPLALEKKSRSRRRTHNSEKSTSTEGNAIDWVHDPSKWGNPAQSWSTNDKCLWLLFVVRQEQGVTEINAPTIIATFCKHFKQAGLIYRQIVARELGRMKSASPHYVGENSTVQPSQWFLTDEGIKRAQNLIEQLRSPTVQSPN